MIWQFVKIIRQIFLWSILPSLFLCSRAYADTVAFPQADYIQGPALDVQIQSSSQVVWQRTLPVTIASPITTTVGGTITGITTGQSYTFPSNDRLVVNDRLTALETAVGALQASISPPPTLTGISVPIANSSLANSSITVDAGDGISISGSPVSLGGSIKITATGAKSGISSLNSQTGDLTIQGSGSVGVSTSGNTITISSTGTSTTDTLADVTARGATTADALTLSNASNAITVGTLTATGGSLNGVVIGSTNPTSGTFTTVNGLTITPATAATFTLTAGKTFAVKNSITLQGTDSTTFTLPTASDTLVGLASSGTLSNKTISALSNTLSDIPPSSLSLGDYSSKFNGGPYSFSITGNAASATTASNFSGSLAGDVTGLQGSTVVGKINGNPLGLTTPNIGNILIGNGTSWATQSLTGDASISALGFFSINYASAQAADATHKGFLTASDWNIFNSKQVALGFTPENIVNKSTDVTTDATSDIKYPSVKAVKTYVDNLSTGLKWLNPISLCCVIADTNSPPGSPVLGDAYLITTGGNIGAWSSFNPGDFVQYQGSGWVLIKSGAVGDYFGIAFNTSTTPYNSFSGKKSYLVQLSGGTPGSFTYTFTAPAANDAVFVNSTNAYYSGATFAYSGDLSKWVQLSSSLNFQFTNGLEKIGNNVSLGALTSDWNQTGAYNIITAGDIGINGGDLTTTSTSATLFNTNATTLSIGGAATTIHIGTAGGTTLQAADALTIESGNTANLDIESGGDGSINIGSDIDSEAITIGSSTSGKALSLFGGPTWSLTSGGNFTTLGNLTTTSGGSINSSGLLTAQNGLTLASGGINLTATNGALLLSGLSASSLSTGINALTITSSNFNTTSTGINNTAIGATTPNTGTFTTINGMTITNNGSNTLTIAGGKVFTVNNSLTFTGTDGTSFAFPSSSDDIVGRTISQTLTNKTIAAGSNTITGLTNANLSGTAGISNANLANTALTVSAGTGLTGGGLTSLGGTTTLSLANTTVTLGSYGASGTTVPTFTVDSQGRLTAAGSYTISGLTNANLSGSAGITNANLSTPSLTFQGNTGSFASLLGTIVQLSGAGITTVAASGNTLTLTTLEADTLQSVYNRGNTITTTSGNNLSVTLPSGLASPTSFSLTNNGTANSLVLTDAANSSFDSLNRSTLAIQPGAITQNTLASSGVYNGMVISLPPLTLTSGTSLTGSGVRVTTGNLTQSTGSLTENGLIVDSSATTLTTGGTLNGVRIDAPTTLSAVGTYNNLYLGTSTSTTANAQDKATIAVGNIASTAQQNFATLNITNGGTGYLDVELLHGMLNLRGMNTLYDDFTSRTLNTTNLWTMTVTGGGSSCAQLAGGVGGLLRLETDTGANRGCELTTQVITTLTNGYYQAQNNPIFETRLTINNLTNFRVAVGFTGTRIAVTADTVTSSNHAYILKRAADTQWQCATDDGGATETITSTGVTIVANTFYRLRVEVRRGSTPETICTVDDGTTVTRTVVTATQPGATSPMDVYVRDNQSDAVIKWMDVDYVRAWQDDPVPSSSNQTNNLAQLASISPTPTDTPLPTPTPDMQSPNHATPSASFISALIQSITDFFTNIVFHKDIAIEGHTTVGVDSAGTVVIKQNQLEQTVLFAQAYATSPVITATAYATANIGDIPSFAITKSSKQGFTITLSREAPFDITFSWIALGASQSLPQPTESVSVTPLPTPTLSVSSPTPTQNTASPSAQ